MKDFQASSFSLLVLALSYTTSGLVASPPRQHLGTGIFPVPTGLIARFPHQPLSATRPVPKSTLALGPPVPTGLAISLVARQAQAGQNISLIPIQPSTFPITGLVTLSLRPRSPSFVGTPLVISVRPSSVVEAAIPKTRATNPSVVVASSEFSATTPTATQFSVVPPEEPTDSVPNPDITDTTQEGPSPNSARDISQKAALDKHQNYTSDTSQNATHGTYLNSARDTSQNSAPDKYQNPAPDTSQNSSPDKN